MELKTYYLSLSADAKAALAQAVGTSVAYLSQLAHEHRKASVPMAKAIEDATQRKVRRHEIRPDIFDAPRKGRAA